MKPIQGYDQYTVSDDGRVFNSRSGKERALDFNKAVGYYQVDLYAQNERKKYYVHRLVAQTYVPNPGNLPEVNHKDSDRTNNRHTNLEWVSSSGNSVHCVQAGQRDHVARMQPNQIAEALRLVMDGMSYTDVSVCMGNCWGPGFLSVKVGKLADSLGTRDALKAELKRQRVVRSIKNLESINSK